MWRCEAGHAHGVRRFLQLASPGWQAQLLNFRDIGQVDSNDVGDGHGRTVTIHHCAECIRHLIT